MINGLSIDLEEWFCVSNFAGVFRPEQWPDLPGRIAAPTRLILDRLAARGVRATFFVLGWVAERYPALLREIAAQGHEIATHGYGHQLVYNMAPDDFRADLARSLEIIRAATGLACRGYRAPSFSVRCDMAWFWDALWDAGIRYDSSVFPVPHKRYGANPGASRFAFDIPVRAGAIRELPPATIRLGRRNVPVAGGGYLRLYPYPLTRRAIRRINAEGHPAIVYCHPWEFDPAQPVPAGVGRLTTWRHRVGMAGMPRKLDRLLADFAFAPLAQLAGVSPPGP